MSPPIRILSVIDGLGFAGDETRLFNMSRQLDRTRFRHSVLTLNQNHYGAADEYESRKSLFISAGIVVESLADRVPEKARDFKGPAARVYSKTGIYRRARRLAHLVRDDRIDFIDGRLESAGLVGALAGRLSGTPASITLYGGYAADKGLTWPWTTRLAVRLATSVITDSHVRGDQMRAFLHRGASKVLVIPNGIARPTSVRSSAEMRRVLGLPDDPRIRVIGQIGRLIEYKGHESLIRTAQKVLAVEPNVAFLLVGYARRGEYKQHLRHLTEQLGIADRVAITEYAGDIADVWNAIDIHVHASLFDSLPISIAEGMSLAKPAVVSNAGGIPEIVLDGETGLVFPAGDCDAMAAALLKILQKPVLARQLGDAARKRYDDLYRPETMARALEQHFTCMTRKI